MPVITTAKRLTPFQQHVADWHDCHRCPLHRVRTQVVLARGTVPCRVLCIGEAPGRSEDVVGLPFVGPAGHVMDYILKRSLTPDTSYALTNLVACLPLDDDGDKTAEPPEEAITACRPRLEEFIWLANPDLLVTVGRLATDWLALGLMHGVAMPRSIQRISLKHPAAIIRENVAVRGLSIQREVAALRNAVFDLSR